MFSVQHFLKINVQCLDLDMLLGVESNVNAATVFVLCLVENERKKG